jgi:hypothetical protein
MSKKPRRRPTHEDEPADKDVRDLREKVRHLKAIQAQYADRIIAAGVFGADEQWTEIAAQLGGKEAKPYEDAFATLLGDMRMPEPVKRPWSSSQDMAAVDALCSVYTPYLDAGFLVGLAVGMQLGPHAFAKGAKGGAR